MHKEINAESYKRTESLIRALIDDIDILFRVIELGSAIYVPDNKYEHLARYFYRQVIEGSGIIYPTARLKTKRGSIFYDYDYCFIYFEHLIYNAIDQVHQEHIIRDLMPLYCRISDLIAQWCVILPTKLIDKETPDAFRTNFENKRKAVAKWSQKTGLQAPFSVSANVKKGEIYFDRISIWDVAGLKLNDSSRRFINSFIWDIIIYARSYKCMIERVCEIYKITAVRRNFTIK